MSEQVDLPTEAGDAALMERVRGSVANHDGAAVTFLPGVSRERIAVTVIVAVDYFDELLPLTLAYELEAVAAELRRDEYIRQGREQGGQHE